jgi:hypothetical protein
VKSEYKRRALDALADIAPRYWRFDVSAYNLRDVLVAFRAAGIDDLMLQPRLIVSLTSYLGFEKRLLREWFNVPRVDVKRIDTGPMRELNEPVALVIEGMKEAAKPFWAKPPRRDVFLQGVVRAYSHAAKYSNLMGSCRVGRANLFFKV